jgi:uncharacterized protein (TIGR02145 family)
LPIIACIILFSCDGTSFKEVSIGNQVWMVENLNVDRFRNGDPIWEAKSDEEWEEAGDNGKPAWCYYDNNPENGARYGKLYNWFAVSDPRGLAPEGWKIPSDEDWSSLTLFLGGGVRAGEKLKFTDFWAENDGESGNGTNESGFTGLPGGERHLNGSFRTIEKFGYWWSSTENNKFTALHRQLYYNRDKMDRDFISKKGGASVRCLRH